MSEYAPETLRKLWDVEEGIYREFARICDKHGLRYFCAYGSALGAIRHQGFIPWDDDMDVAMPREDYETFLKIAPEETSSPFELLEARRTKGYVLPFAKLTRSDTTFVEATDQDRTYHSGIYVDIFPLDLVYEDLAERNKLLRKGWVLSRLCVLSEYKHPKLPQSMSPAKRAVAHFGCAVIHYALRLFGQTNKKFHERYVHAITRAAREGCTELYADALLYNYENNYGQVDVCYRREDLFPTTTAHFDDMIVPVPGNYDAYLTATYGDYMQLPPEDKRHCHFPAVLDFGEAEKELV